MTNSINWDYQSNNLAINQPTPDIEKWHTRWAKNRAFVDGQEAVKAADELYLPRNREDDSDGQYQNHLMRTNFNPAANKVAQGMLGLIFRKNPALTASTAIASLCQYITPDYQSLDELSEELVRETIITDWNYLLADHPSENDFTNLSAANALEQGFRPTLALYCAESILEYRLGVVRKMRVPVRIRLLEDQGHQVRELLINSQGFYEVRVHRDDGNFTFSKPPQVFVPRRNGQPLTMIPGVLVSTHGKSSPRPAPITATVDLNAQHYIASGTLAQIIWMTAGPNITVSNVGDMLDEEKKEIPFQFDNTPGAVNWFKADAKVFYNTYEPEGAELLINDIKGIEEKLSANGHSIIRPEKAAPEAPETEMIRRAAENAILAALSRSISGKIVKALREFAQWVDGSEVAYSLNTDFAPQQMSEGMIAALSTLVDKGQLSLHMFRLLMRDGEVLRPSFDPEEERSRIEQELADRPSVDL